MKKQEAIRLVQVEQTHQIHYDCDNVGLLREVTGNIKLIGAFDFYTYEDCKDVPYFSRPIIKLSEITEEEELDNTERVIEVFDGGEWVPRVLIAFKNNKALCWSCSETIEESKNVSKATLWDEWREIQPKVELTNYEFEKLVGCKFENFKIKE